MPSVEMDLQEQHGDLRSSEVAYRLTITNRDVAPIDIVAVDPRTPEGVEITEVGSPTVAAVKAAHSLLCDEITRILNDQLEASVEDFRNQLLQIEKERAETIRKEARKQSLFSLVIASYLKFTGLIEPLAISRGADARAQERRASLTYEILNCADGKYALNHLFPGDDGTARRVFEAKLDQLQRLEKELGTDEVKSKTLATINPDSSYIPTYVLQFPRDNLNPRKFNIAFDVRYTDEGGDYVDVASTSLLISPRAATVNLVAVVGGLLGVMLEFVISTDRDLSFQRLATTEFDPLILPAVGGVILSFVVFNIYEHIDALKTMKLAISWRSALLVGFLAGFFQDRIIAALGALVGLA